MTRSRSASRNPTLRTTGRLGTLAISAVAALAPVASAQIIDEFSGDAFVSPYYTTQVFHGFQGTGTGFTLEDGIVYSSNIAPRNSAFLNNAVAQENGSTMNSNASSFPSGFFGGRNSVQQTVSNASVNSGYYTLAGTGSRTRVQFYTPEAAAQRSVFRWRVTGTQQVQVGEATGRLDFLAGRLNDRDFFYVFDETSGALKVFGPGEYTYNLNAQLDVPIDLFFWCSAYSQVNRGQAAQGSSFMNFANYGNTYELIDIDLFADAAGTQPITQWTMADMSTNQFVFNQNGPLPPCTPPPSDMVAWYVGEGSVADFSGNGRHGTVQGNTSFTLGAVGQAFDFDGSNDFARIPDDPSLRPQQLTVDAWVFARGVGDINDALGAVIFAKDLGSASGAPVSFALFGPGNTNKFHAQLRFTDATTVNLPSAGSFAFNQWHHVAMTWDGTTLRLYVNGNLEGSNTPSGGPKTIAYSTDDYAIGRHSHVDRSFNGLIDEVEFFSRALAESEIDAIIAAGGAGKCRPIGGITFKVNTTSDSDDGTCSLSHCSLREALTIANATAGPDTIAFNISGNGVQAIGVSGALPAITSPVTIDGYTQPGSSANTLVWGNNALPLIQLNGAATDNANGLVVQSSGSGSTIRGLIISGFDGPFNFNSSGVRLEDGSSSNAVEGCFIGTNATGTDYGQNTNGIFLINSDGNRIGGTTPAQRNLISGNNNYGIDIFAGSDNNVIQGNYIGTNKAGSSGLVNVAGGIHINSSSNNLIGGTDEVAPTVANRGVAVASLGGVGLPQRQRRSSDPNGGGVVAPIYFNVISGNNGPGIQIIGGEFEGQSAEGNRILGNYIGLDGDTDPDNSFAVGNEDQGILILQFVHDTRIGETFGGGNFIAYNFGDGVQITDNFSDLRPGRASRPNGDAGDSAGNQVINNSIFANEGLGINLGKDEATANDSQDADIGPNGFQNYPVLTSAETTGVSTTVQGTLNSTPNSIFRIDFYHSNDPCDGSAEGANPLGSTVVATNGNGDASFSFTGGAVSEGATITATATTALVIPGSTSEFSACVQATPASLNLTAAASRELHEGAGVFDINLPLSGTPGIESRDPTGQHRLVFTFSTAVVSGNASVTSGSATPDGVTFSGNTMLVDLVNVADVQTITVTLSSVTDSFGQTLPDTSVQMTKLVGDTNGNGMVNSGDATQTRNRSGQEASATNFRSDVNVDGTVNSGDGLIVREKSGNSVNP